jgi:hypothetical protein
MLIKTLSIDVNVVRELISGQPHPGRPALNKHTRRSRTVS